mmetsp:Transcript_70427/g.217558  ORF Transcript_70427/g.217558 Transcript_70427/m.217558 type:complete len:285 (-) Transcript_70427:1215-2069(-)
MGGPGCAESNGHAPALPADGWSTVDAGSAADDGTHGFQPAGRCCRRMVGEGLWLHHLCRRAPSLRPPHIGGEPRRQRWPGRPEAGRGRGRHHRRGLPKRGEVGCAGRPEEVTHSGAVRRTRHDVLAALQAFPGQHSNVPHERRPWPRTDGGRREGVEPSRLWVHRLPRRPTSLRAPLIHWRWKPTGGRGSHCHAGGGFQEPRQVGCHRCRPEFHDQEFDLQLAACDAGDAGDGGNAGHVGNVGDADDADDGATASPRPCSGAAGCSDDGHQGAACCRRQGQRAA